MKKPPLIHDLKNERQGLTPALPGVMAVIPLFFYTSLAGAAVLGTFSMLGTKKAITAEQAALAEESDQQSQTALIQKSLVSIMEEQTKAKEVQNWVHSTTPLMTMITGVVNSIKSGNTLTSLSLSRSPENPEHVEMTLLINNGGTAQVEDTRSALSREGYQAFREDTKTGNGKDRLGDVNYSAVFVNTGNPVSTASGTRP